MAEQLESLASPLNTIQVGLKASLRKPRLPHWCSSAESIVWTASALDFQCWNSFSTRFPVLIGLVRVLKLPQHWFSSAEFLSALVFQCWTSVSTRFPVLNGHQHWVTSAEIRGYRGRVRSKVIQHWLPSAETAVSTGTECWYTKTSPSALDLPVLEDTSALENQCYEIFSTGKRVLTSLKDWNDVRTSADVLPALESPSAERGTRRKFEGKISYFVQRKL